MLLGARNPFSGDVERLLLPSVLSSAIETDLSVSPGSELLPLHLEHEDHDDPGVILSVPLPSCDRLNKTLYGVMISGGEKAHESTGDTLVSTGDKDRFREGCIHSLADEWNALVCARHGRPLSRIDIPSSSRSRDGDLRVEQRRRGSLSDELVRRGRRGRRREPTVIFCSCCVRSSLARDAPDNDTAIGVARLAWVATVNAGSAAGSDIYSTGCR